MKSKLIIALLCTQPLGSALAETGANPNLTHWPQWRGPLANGVSPIADPPLTWSPSSNILWKVAIPGSGTATPIVWDDWVFIQTAVPTGKKVEADAVAAEAPNPPPNAPGGRAGGPPAVKPDEVYRFLLLALDRKTGQTRWEQVVREEAPQEGHHRDHGYASYSPVTDGNQVYSYFGSRGLHCYDFQGNLKWEKDLGRMKTKMSFGEGSSPALSGHTLVVNWDHEGDDFIVALDTESGKELWRQPREEDTSWATPLIVTHEGQTQVITDASRKIRSYDLGTGKLLWECAGLTANVIPSPVADGGIVYAISGFRGNALLAILLGRTGDLTGTDAIVWSYKKNTPYVPSPLLYGGGLYFYSANNAVLTCLDAKTGAVRIDAQKVAALEGVYSSPVGAAGRIYLVGRNGATVVIKNSPTYKVLATNTLAEGFDASPALAGGQIFLRGRENLYCIGAR